MVEVKCRFLESHPPITVCLALILELLQRSQALALLPLRRPTLFLVLCHCHRRGSLRLLFGFLPTRLGLVGCSLTQSRSLLGPLGAIVAITVILGALLGLVWVFPLLPSFALLVFLRGLGLLGLGHPSRSPLPDDEPAPLCAVKPLKGVDDDVKRFHHVPSLAHGLDTHVVVLDHSAEKGEEAALPQIIVEEPSLELVCGLSVRLGSNLVCQVQDIHHLLEKPERARLQVPILLLSPGANANKSQWIGSGDKFWEKKEREKTSNANSPGGDFNLLLPHREQEVEHVPPHGGTDLREGRLSRHLILFPELPLAHLLHHELLVRGAEAA